MQWAGVERISYSPNRNEIRCSKKNLGADYMIPVYWDENSPRPTGAGLTLRLHVEIKFRRSKAGQLTFA